MGEDTTGRPSGRRVTVDEAARELGLSVDAIRKRVQRKKIAHDRDAAGRVRIILDSPDNASTVQDARQDATGPGRSELAILREHNAYLQGVIATRDEDLRGMREALERRDRDLERRDRLLADSMERTRELERRLDMLPPASSEARESPVSPDPSPTPQAPDGEAHRAAERPFTEEEGPRTSWWRRFFGF